MPTSFTPPLITCISPCFGGEHEEHEPLSVVNEGDSGVEGEKTCLYSLANCCFEGGFSSVDDFDLTVKLANRNLATEPLGGGGDASFLFAFFLLEPLGGSRCGGGGRDASFILEPLGGGGGAFLLTWLPWYLMIHVATEGCSKRRNVVMPPMASILHAPRAVVLDVSDTSGRKMKWRSFSSMSYSFIACTTASLLRFRPTVIIL